MVQKIETILCDLRQYHEWMDEESFESLQRLATRLRGLKVGHVNATSRGGGVAEILTSLVPLMNRLGNLFFLDFYPQATFFD